MHDGDEGKFTDDEQRALSILVEMIIPESDEYGVPGASDVSIFSTILIDAERRRSRIIAALSALDDLALENHGAGFVDLSDEQREGVAETFRDSHPANANLIVALTTQCYYRDDRVVVALGMEPRPPHPEGYTVEQGDWSLLDPVRKRTEFYRKTK
ncbi:MAG: gluconate 2-dehydrogenase subunit 3 family protein [Rhodospirillaceae bacterium]|jgi:hypothetical protein|nr:gluconate 2-dehydrogenase subunit 3 family protein [Rhodospirillaceae bacterium]